MKEVKKIVNSSLTTTILILTSLSRAMDPPLEKFATLDTIENKKTGKMIHKTSSYFSKEAQLPNKIDVCLTKSELRTLKQNIINVKYNQLDHVTNENLCSLYCIATKLKMTRCHLKMQEECKKREISIPKIAWASAFLNDNKKKYLDCNSHSVYLSPALYNESTVIKNQLEDCNQEEAPIQIDFDFKEFDSLMKIDKHIFYRIMGNTEEKKVKYVKDRCLEGILSKTIFFDDIINAFKVSDFLGITSVTNGLRKSLKKCLTKKEKIPNDLKYNLFIFCNALTQNPSATQMLLKKSEKIIRNFLIYKSGQTKTFINKSNCPNPNILIIDKEPAIMTYKASTRETSGEIKIFCCNYILNKNIKNFQCANASLNRKQIILQYIGTSEIEIFDANKLNSIFWFYQYRKKINIDPKIYTYSIANEKSAIFFKKNTYEICSATSKDQSSCIGLPDEIVKKASISPNGNHIACILESNKLHILKKNDDGFFNLEKIISKPLKIKIKAIFFDNESKQLACLSNEKILLYDLRRNRRSSIRISKDKVIKDFCFSENNKNLYVLTNKSFDVYTIKSGIAQTIFNHFSPESLIATAVFTTLNENKKKEFINEENTIKSTITQSFLCCNKKECSCDEITKRNLEKAKTWILPQKKDQTIY